MSENNEAFRGHINIEVDDNDVKYGSNLSVPEVIFWIRMLEHMIMKQVTDENEQ